MVVAGGPSSNGVVIPEPGNAADRGRAFGVRR